MAPPSSSQSIAGAVSQEQVDATTAELLQKYEKLKAYDNCKNQLIEELIFRYEYQNKAIAQNAEILQHAVALQKSNEALNERLRLQEESFNRNAFVLVLIDGDGMIFNEQALRGGAKGGRMAANYLHNCIKAHIEQTLPELHSGVKVITKMYGNRDGLGEALYRNGIVNDPGQADSFLWALTSPQPLCDFVDVGPGKDLAFVKISELFKLYVHDPHCRHIYLGCSGNDGYAQLLEPYAGHSSVIGRVTLVQGVPFKKELAALYFPSTQFNNLFRSLEINIYGLSVDADGNVVSGYAPGPIGTRISGAAAPTNRAHENYTPPTSSVTTTPFNAAAVPFLPRRLSSSTAASSEAQPKENPPNTWANLAKQAHVKAEAAAVVAAKAAAAGKVMLPPPTPQELLNKGIIPRNRNGQRIDPHPRAYDKDEVNCMRRMKLCNVQNLRGPCPFGSKCTHDHDYKPTKDELSVLKLVARLAPCNNGAECEDVGCIYGHRCIVASKPGLEGNGGKNCIMGDDCYFDAALHNVDTKLVLTTKI
ncbi:hypothetical protein NA57DRAFT_70099 [Rhizodiscina lignyota]|uniref:C3H1-type domain-containing protein n=1 Tax=Rhizodiscina lignyota TaxID=1504668 RepID=A0A9P4IMK0_9PEZI|nr:hypothetical protein NA57DRAFT_70099 [Rhizodiscina lignyota]